MDANSGDASSFSRAAAPTHNNSGNMWAAALALVRLAAHADVGRAAHRRPICILTTTIVYMYISSACAVPGATTPRWVQRRPCAPAARRAAAGYTPVICSSLPEGPPPPIRRSANYQPNSWNYGYMESLAAGNDNKRDRRLVGFDLHLYMYNSCIISLFVRVSRLRKIMINDLIYLLTSSRQQKYANTQFE
jgi:hypothetical protein